MVPENLTHDLHWSEKWRGTCGFVPHLQRLSKLWFSFLVSQILFGKKTLNLHNLCKDLHCKSYNLPAHEAYSDPLADGNTGQKLHVPSSKKNLLYSATLGLAHETSLHLLYLYRVTEYKQNGVNKYTNGHQKAQGGGTRASRLELPLRGLENLFHRKKKYVTKSVEIEDCI